MKEEGDCFQGFQEQLLMQQFQTMQQNADVFGVGGGGLIFPEVSPMMFPPPWTAATTTTLPQVHGFNPTRDHHDPFIPPPPPASYASFFNRRNASLQFPYDIANNNLGIGQMGQPGSAPFGLQAELTKMTAQEIMDAKALAASKSHSEAERRRRERINKHLAKLRSLLPSTTKVSCSSKQMERKFA